MFCASHNNILAVVNHNLKNDLLNKISTSFLSTLDYLLQMHILFSKKVLVIYRQQSNHDNFIYRYIIFFYTLPLSNFGFFFELPASSSSLADLCRWIIRSSSVSLGSMPALTCQVKSVMCNYTCISENIFSINLADYNIHNKKNLLKM